MKKKIEIKKTESGNEYIIIYEVRVITKDGERITYERYANKKDAEQDIEFILDHMQNLYTHAWLLQHMVWI